MKREFVVPSPIQESSPIAQKLREMRLANQLGPALQLASQTISAQPNDWGAMGEAVRILICLEQPQPAAQLYQAFTADPALNNNLAPEVLVRLALQLDRRDLLEGMEPPAGPSWLVELLGNGQDPAEVMKVAKVQMRSDGGHPIFHFQGNCPHCGQKVSQEFRATLLVYREWICTHCFGKVAMNHATARAAIRDHYSAQDSRLLREQDSLMIDHLRPGLTGEKPVPKVVQALAQEYHFLLNELVVKFSADSGDEETTS